MNQAKKSKKSLAYDSPPERLSDWSQAKIYQVTHEGETFNVIKYAGSLYVGGDDMALPRRDPERPSWWGTGEPSNFKAVIDITVGTDQSCAYLRFCPRYCKYSPSGKQIPPEYPASLDWAYEKYLKIPKATTCYLTKEDGPVRTLLAALKKRGFHHVATNKSTHSGRYPVYLLVHPGDGSKIKTKTEKLPDVELDPRDEL